jgi:hypothetical protein
MHRTHRFDLRATDFASGKKISPPKSEWRKCACCGLPIVKGFVMSNGESVGEDCEDIISRAGSDKRCGFAADAVAYEARYKRSSGWNLKPAVRRYLSATVFA